MGVPFVVAVAESKIRNHSVDELRKIIADGVAPFLRGAPMLHHAEFALSCVCWRCRRLAEG